MTQSNTTPPAADAAPPANPAEPVVSSIDEFIAFLRQCRRGDLVRDLADATTDVVQRVRETGRAGTLKFTMKFSPESDGEMVQIEDDISVTMPKAKKGKSMFFTTEDGSLSRTDPNQLELKLRDVKSPEFREVKAD